MSDGPTMRSDGKLIVHRVAPALQDLKMLEALIVSPNHRDSDLLGAEATWGPAVAAESEADWRDVTRALARGR